MLGEGMGKDPAREGTAPTARGLHLSVFRLLSQTTLNQVAYKEKLIGSRGCNSETECQYSRVLVRALFWATDDHFLLPSHGREKVRELSVVSL